MLKERPSDRRKRVLEAYVLDRLEKELESHPRGHARRIAEKTGLTPTTISSLRNRSRGVGEDAATLLAHYWGLSGLPELWVVTDDRGYALQINRDRWLPGTEAFALTLDPRSRKTVAEWVELLDRLDGFARRLLL